jgi:Mrp family chromosome partitioning ATPase
MEDELVKRIKRMTEYMDEEAIAGAIRMPSETVRAILAGRAGLKMSEQENQTVLEVQTNPVYRQRIISVWRGRGGVGCTSVALHLASVLEQKMSVLLVDLNVLTAVSDVGYYLGMPPYPNMETLIRKEPLSSAVIQAESALWALLPPISGGIEKGTVEHVTVEARKDFDAIIFDLPNIEADHVMEAVSCSNFLVMVTTGQPQELSRVIARKNSSRKEAVLVANGCNCDGDIRKEFLKTVVIPEDRELPSRMERGVFYKKGTSLTVGAGKIRDILFGMRSQEEGGFRKVMKLFGG